VLMDINLPDIDGFEAARRIIKSVPDTAVIMLSVQESMAYFNRALSIGARGYLVKPVKPDDLYRTIREVQGNKVPPQEPPPPEPPKGKIIAVYSPQGGAGCTTLAINAACGLMAEGAKALLVDADLQFGDLGAVLNLPFERTLVDLVGAGGEVDLELLQAVTVPHSSGLNLLMGARHLEDALRMQPDYAKVASVIEQVARAYEYVVVDTCSHLDELSLSLFDLSARVVLVTTPLLESVKNTRRLLDFFMDGGFPGEKVTVVVNGIPGDRQRRQQIVSTEKIRSFLRQETVAEIPLDEALTREAVSRGVPLVFLDSKQEKPITRELLRLAKRLYAELAAAAAK